MSDNEIILTAEDGSCESFFVIAETQLQGIRYLLVSDADDSSEEANAYILKDVSAADEAQAVYEFVEDEAELDPIADVFGALLGEDADLVD